MQGKWVTLSLNVFCLKAFESYEYGTASVRMRSGGHRGDYLRNDVMQHATTSISNRESADEPRKHEMRTGRNVGTGSAGDMFVQT